MRTGRALSLGVGLLLAAASTAAVRARLGGTLAVGLVGSVPLPSAEPGAESPESRSAQALLALPLCRLTPTLVPVLASVSREGPETVRVRALAGARFPDGRPLGADTLADALRRVALGGTPYRALLAPVAGLPGALEAAARASDGSLPLRLAYPWPDFEVSLCHPAFTPLWSPAKGAPAAGIGLYSRAPDGRLLPTAGTPRGLPFPQALSLTSLSERAAQRLFARGELQAVLGGAPAGPSTEPGPLLFATYLVYRPGALPEGALAALARVDVAALVRTFVPGPAAALRTLLPEALLGGAPGQPAARAPAPPAARTGGAFTLGYESALPEQRAVAERLQVLLHDGGFSLSVRADSREGLERARRDGTLDAALLSVLLPPVPAPALAVVLGLLGEAGLLARELPALGAVADSEARARRVGERALVLQAELPLLPLYVRGLRVKLSPTLLDARRDGFGLLVLDDSWLAP